MISRYEKVRECFNCGVLTTLLVLSTGMSACSGEAVLSGTNAPDLIPMDTNTCHAFVVQSVLQRDGHHFLQLGFMLVPNTNYPGGDSNPPTSIAYTKEFELKYHQWDLDRQGRWPYVQATNALCGPMLLYDANGHGVPSLRPEVNRLSAYPDRFSLRRVTRIFSKPIESEMIPIRYWECHPGHTGGKGFLAPFILEDFFDVQAPGNYELRVWPKLYRCSSTNDDICERLDLPVLKIPLKLDAIQKSGATP